MAVVLGCGCWFFGAVLLGAFFRWVELPALSPLAKFSGEDRCSAVPDNAASRWMDALALSPLAKFNGEDRVSTMPDDVALGWMDAQASSVKFSTDDRGSAVPDDAALRWMDTPAVSPLAKFSEEGRGSTVPDNAPRTAMASQNVSIGIRTSEPIASQASMTTGTGPSCASISVPNDTVAKEPDIVMINWWALAAAVASGFCGHLLVAVASRLTAIATAALAARARAVGKEPPQGLTSTASSISEGAQPADAAAASGCNCGSIQEKLLAEIATLHGEVRLLRTQLLERDLKGAVRTAVANPPNTGNSTSASSGSSEGDSGGPSTPSSTTCRFMRMPSLGLPVHSDARRPLAPECVPQTTSEDQAFRAVLSESFLSECDRHSAQSINGMAVEVEEDTAEDRYEAQSECDSTEETVVFAVTVPSQHWEHASAESSDPEDARALVPTPTPSSDSIVDQLERDLANIIRENDALEQRLTPRGHA